ncbi:hypothetical protein PRIPAC_79822, partial [Pristionchus pacificus]|uniref:G protein-coupled receptor n=1 Tax=Pristionchus pacificus TaxID=54126 RepID=A0A2A6CJT1_PRIPA
VENAHYFEHSHDFHYHLLRSTTRNLSRSACRRESARDTKSILYLTSSLDIEYASMYPSDARLMLRLPSPIPFHDLLFIIVHTTIDSTAILANLVLLLAIALRTPTSLRCFAVLLVNSVLMDKPTGRLNESTKGFFCHCLFIISLSTFAQSLFLNAISFAYRFYILDRPTPRPSRVLLICLLIYAATFATPYLFALDYVNDVRRAISIAKPNYDLDQYAVQGNLNIYEWKPMVAIASIAIPSLPTLVGVVMLRAKVLAKISENSGQMSNKTMRIHSTLAKVLTLQAILPVFFFVGVVNFFLCQLSIVDCSPIQEHLMMQTVSFTPLIAPMITLYYVQPYRE